MALADLPKDTRTTPLALNWHFTTRLPPELTVTRFWPGSLRLCLLRDAVSHQAVSEYTRLGHPPVLTASLARGAMPVGNNYPLYIFSDMDTGSNLDRRTNRKPPN